MYSNVATKVTVLKSPVFPKMKHNKARKIKKNICNWTDPRAMLNINNLKQFICKTGYPEVTSALLVPSTNTAPNNFTHK